MSKQTIFGLTRRRRELACRMNMLAEEHAKLATELAALDQVLRMFDPDLEPDEIPALQIVSRPMWAKRGEITRTVFSVLRKANAPLSTDEITARVAQDRRELPSARIRKSVYKVLDQKRQRGLIASLPGERGMLVWSLAPQA